VPFAEVWPTRLVARPTWLATDDVAVGGSAQPMRAGACRLGILICFEVERPILAARYAAEGADALVVLSNDAQLPARAGASESTVMGPEGNTGRASGSGARTVRRSTFHERDHVAREGFEQRRRIPDWRLRYWCFVRSRRHRISTASSLWADNVEPNLESTVGLSRCRKRDDCVHAGYWPR